MNPKYQKHCKLKERSKLKTSSSKYYKNTPSITINLSPGENKPFLVKKENKEPNLRNSPGFSLDLSKLEKKNSRNCKTSRSFYPKNYSSIKDKDSCYFKSGIQAKDTRKCKGKNPKFPNGGWVCSSCQNYNFNGRKKWNRCKKSKDTQDFNGKPLHLLKAEGKIPDHFPTFGLGIANNSKSRNGEIPISTYSAVREAELGGINSARSYQPETLEPFEKSSGKSKKLVKRKGDWTWECKNLNFAFRKYCNRCRKVRE